MQGLFCVSIMHQNINLYYRIAYMKPLNNKLLSGVASSTAYPVHTICCSDMCLNK